MELSSSSLIGCNSDFNSIIEIENIFPEISRPDTHNSVSNHQIRWLNGRCREQHKWQRVQCLSMQVFPHKTVAVSWGAQGTMSYRKGRVLGSSGIFWFRAWSHLFVAAALLTGRLHPPFFWSKACKVQLVKAVLRVPHPSLFPWFISGCQW